MIVSIKNIKNFDKTEIPIIRNEIFNLFINNNRNTKFLRLCFPQQFDYQLHRISGAEHCFSKLESFRCYANTNKYILEGLAGISKSIKKLIFDIMYSINSGIIKLIEAQNNLKEVHFIDHTINLRDESFNINWNHLEKLSLPLLKFLRTQKVPSRILSNIIENTKGYLTEISILYEGINDKKLIPTIYHNCPNLKYLKLSLSVRNIIEFENLLNNCQLLNGLVVDIYDHIIKFDWDKLFKILSKSSPISLIKFKFSSNRIISLETLKLFFDNWKNRNPMFLHIIPMYCFTRAEQRKQKQQELQQLENLIKEYKVKEMIKRYYVDSHGSAFEDFEWIQRRSDAYIEF
ncbi:2598_t:CDS:2 [Rhizophagus irregularis]|nr:2598_t:CDS:2 [Rhizophagus irregularis]